MSIFDRLNLTTAADGGSNLYLAPAFYFSVVFLRNLGGLENDLREENSFTEVSGLAPEFELESVKEGGENRFTHQLPKRVKHPKLVLKRGRAPIDSALAQWCSETLEYGLVSGVRPMDLSVRLLDEKGEPLRAWDVVNAFPVKWEVDGFNSTKNEIAIEKIELSYNFSNRIR